MPNDYRPRAGKSVGLLLGPRNGGNLRTLLEKQCERVLDGLEFLKNPTTDRLAESLREKRNTVCHRMNELAGQPFLEDSLPPKDDGTQADLQAEQNEPGETPGGGPMTQHRAKRKGQKRMPGRKPLDRTEIENRERILAAWKDAQPAHVNRQRFCEDEGIEIRDLEKYQAWERQRKARGQ
jgi:hypothetical protein